MNAPESDGRPSSPQRDDAPVAIIMGSQSDWATMRHAAETLDALAIGFDARIVSAHRTPDRLVSFAKGAKAAGFRVVIAGAGGAAHGARRFAFGQFAAVFARRANAADRLPAQ